MLKSVNLSQMKKLISKIEEIGDDHHFTASDNPMHADAFKLNDSEKIEIIAKHFESIMHTWVWI